MIKHTKFNLKLSTYAALLALSGAACSAVAEDEYTFMDSVKEGKNLTSFRLRYENVSQDGNSPALTPVMPLEDGEALTLRSLIGWKTSPYHNLSFAAQLINVAKLSDDYNDGTSFTPINAASNQPGKLAFAKTVDPDYTGVNQLYVDWTGIKNTRLRVGRQAVNLDNVRYIGDIGFRQVMQVFDGVSVLNKSIPDTEVFLGHMESVRQITTKLRTGGALEIINAKYYITPTESLTGYAYLSSFDDLGLGNAWFGTGAANTAAKSAASSATDAWMAFTGASPTSSSSEKSSAASTCADISSSRADQPDTARLTAPSTDAIAARRCDSVCAVSKSPSPSASARSIRPDISARRVNSPASAGRSPGMLPSAAATAAITARPPWR